MGLCIGRSAAGLIGAILTRNLGNVIINAAVDGTRNFIVALGAGAGAIVSGIESAQLGITTALATEPPPATAADIPGLRTLAVGRTFSLGAASSVVTDAAVSAPQDEATGETDVVATGADAEPQDPLKAPAVTDVSPSSDISRDVPEPAALSKKAVDATPVKGAPKEVDGTVEKVAAAVEKHDGVKDGTGVNNDAGTDAKPASDSDDK